MMTSESDDELLCFLEEDDTADQKAILPWRILVVDDDLDVHDSTELAMRGLSILGRPLEFIHAYSGAECLEVLRQHKEVAVILLDVVMESDDAGLKTVARIRHDLGLAETRIILRTGQPGYAPEMEAISLYDINDYKTKNELTRIKLYTALTCAIRSYDQLQRMNQSRRGLEQILSASHHLLSIQGLNHFSEGVIIQIASFIGIEPCGFICIGSPSHGAQHEIFGASGRYAYLLHRSLADIEEGSVRQSIQRCLAERQTLIEEESITLYCAGQGDRDIVAFFDAKIPPDSVNLNLLSLFCTNIGLCADHVALVEQLRGVAQP